MDVFNEACAERLAAQFNATRGRGHRELEQLIGCTQFTKAELKVLYWGWKCSCLSGCLTESTFKGNEVRDCHECDIHLSHFLSLSADIYAQFFPQAGQFLSPDLSTN